MFTIGHHDKFNVHKQGHCKLSSALKRPEECVEKKALINNHRVKQQPSTTIRKCTTSIRIRIIIFSLVLLTTFTEQIASGTLEIDTNPLGIPALQKLGKTLSPYYNIYPDAFLDPVSTVTR